MVEEAGGSVDGRGVGRLALAGRGGEAAAGVGLIEELEVVVEESVGPVGTVGAVVESDGASGSVAAALNGGAGLEGPGFVVGELSLVAGEESFEVVPAFLRGEEEGEACVGWGLVGETGFAGAKDVERAVVGEEVIGDQ